MSKRAFIVLSKGHLTRAKKSGTALTCAICHKPVKIGEVVRSNYQSSIFKYRHKACFEESLIGE